MTTKTHLFTDAQAVQMSADTFITTLDHGKGRAVVRNLDVSERDPRFFMDRDWLAWFEATMPMWEVVSMNDSHEVDIAWVVTLHRLHD